MTIQDVTLTLTARQAAELRNHLLPGDGDEAVALLLCGRARPQRDRQRLLVHRVVLIPHDQCNRSPNHVTWKTESVLPPLIEEAIARNMAIVKMHSHPGGYEKFSPTDDASDHELFESIFNFIETGEPHASAIMLPDGRIFGRWFSERVEHRPLTCVSVIGDDIVRWRAEPIVDDRSAYAVRNIQAFGAGTYRMLRDLRIGVVGCSGTGSLVVEQLARLGVGHLVLVDPDVVEYKNLNRIVNATSRDAALKTPKVDVLARAVASMGFGTTIETWKESIAHKSVVRSVSGCDVLFGCMDSAEGRNVLNRIGAFYLLPYFDVGVLLQAAPAGGIEDIFGSVHYVQPDGSSLLDRGVYTHKDLEAESLRRNDPNEYAKRLRAGYIRGVNEDRPAVVSVNTFYASMCVNEFLARIHPYRTEPNARYAQHRYVLSRDELFLEDDGTPSNRLAKYVGKGDMMPLLDMPALTE